MRPLRSFSPATMYSLRLATAISAAIWIGSAPGLATNRPSWILITAIFLIQPTAGASLLKSLLRAVGTLAGALSAILLFGFYSQDPPLFLFGLFLVQAVAAYGYSGTRFQYAWFVWAFTTAIVLGSAVGGEGAVETLAFQRASMVAIGIVIVFVVDSFFVTERAEVQLRESLGSRALEIAVRLRRALDGSIDHSGEEPGGASHRDSGPGAVASQLGLVETMRSEIGVSAGTADALAELAVQLETIASRVRGMALESDSVAGASTAEGELLTREQSELARRIELALEEIAAAVRSARAPAPFSDGLSQSIEALEASRGRDDREHGSHPSGAGRLADLCELASHLREIEASLVSVERPTTASEKGPLFEMRTDPLRVKVALRTGIAVVLAFVVSQALGWPLNTVVAPVAFQFAAAPTRGAVYQTVSAIVPVVLIAWLVTDFCIVYLMPHLGRVPAALVVPFAICVSFVAIATRWPRMGMMSSIGALIPLLSIFGSMSAPTDVYGSYNIVCYIGLGILVGSLCARTIWSETAAGLFRERLAAEFALCHGFVRIEYESSRESGGAGRIHRASGFVRNSIAHFGSLGGLHAQALHELVEEDLDPARRTEVLALATDLMDAVVGDSREATECIEEAVSRGGASCRGLLEALKREEEALNESMQASVGVVKGDVARPSSDLASARRSVEQCWSQFESDPGGLESLDREQSWRLFAGLEARKRLVFAQQGVEGWLASWRSAPTDPAEA